MKTTKVNIGLSLSRNFDKITLERVDESISHNNDEDFVAEVKKRFSLLRGEIEKEFKNVQRWVWKRSKSKIWRDWS